MRNIILEHRDSVINTYGRFSIPELCCLMKRFNLLITVDSFSMHAASAVGTPIIAIFSAANDPKR
jgi:ADP-heptose:LPS heptosyltransferase